MFYILVRNSSSLNSSFLVSHRGIDQPKLNISNVRAWSKFMGARNLSNTVRTLKMGIFGHISYCYKSHWAKVWKKVQFKEVNCATTHYLLQVFSISSSLWKLQLKTNLVQFIFPFGKRFLFNICRIRKNKKFHPDFSLATYMLVLQKLSKFSQNSPN